MAQVVDGRYTARMDKPIAVFIIGDVASASQRPCCYRPLGDSGELYQRSSRCPYCSTR